MMDLNCNYELKAVLTYIKYRLNLDEWTFSQANIAYELNIHKRQISRIFKLLTKSKAVEVCGHKTIGRNKITLYSTIIQQLNEYIKSLTIKESPIETHPADEFPKVINESHTRTNESPVEISGSHKEPNESPNVPYNKDIKEEYKTKIENKNDIIIQNSKVESNLKHIPYTGKHNGIDNNGNPTWISHPADIVIPFKTEEEMELAFLETFGK
jgi:hypothetical protein